MQSNTPLKHKLPNRGELMRMIADIEGVLPMTKSQIIRRAVQKYYNQFKQGVDAKRNGRIARGHLLIQQKHQCYYCHKFLNYKDITIDHKIPLARGGSTEIENLCVSCASCNNEKSNMTEEEYLEFKTVDKFA